MLLSVLQHGSNLLCLLYLCLLAGYSHKLLRLRAPVAVSYLVLTALVLCNAVVRGQMLTQLRWLLVALLVMVYYVIFFDSRPIHALFFCNLGLATLMALRSIWLAIASLVIQRPMIEILYGDVIPITSRFWGYLLACLLLLYVRHRYSAERVRPVLENPRILRLLVFSQTLFHIFLIVAAATAYADVRSYWYSIYHLGSCLLLLLTFYIFFDYCVNVSYVYGVELRASLLRDQLQKQLKHYSLMSDYVTNLRKLEHDYRSMVNGVTHLLELEDVDGARAFVQDMQGQLVQATGSYRSYSNHPFVQAILTDVAEQAAHSSIEFQAEVAVPSGFSMREIDICRIFNNLLSNAVEACERLSEGCARYIILRGLRHGNWFLLTIQNSFDGVLQEPGSWPLTRKENATEHGMGLQNVREIVEHYGGVLRLEPNSAQRNFTVSLHLPFSSPEPPTGATFD